MSGEVVRARVHRLLDGAVSRRLTLVTAGPGWGKTTAVAAWARQSPLRDRLAWVTVTDGDDTPMAFWSSVFATAQASGLLSPEDVPMLQVATTEEESEAALSELYRRLARTAEPIVIVLDDFHRIQDRAVLASVTDALTLARPLRLVLLARSDPALPLHRFRLTGELLEVDSRLLAFDLDDVVALSAAMDGPVAIAPATAQDVLAQTHGWPAGVRLALLYQARRAADEDPLAGFSGSERSVSEYLVAEVVAGLDERDHRFLQRTSIVDPLPADLADVLDDDTSALDRLERLVRANLFVNAVDDSRQTFRYHPLLGDLMRHSLRRDDPHAYAEGHRRAASWLARNGDPVAAIEHAVTAGDLDLALECSLAAAPSLVGSSRFRLHRALSSIPFDQMPETPEREITAAGMDVITGDYDAVSARLASARRLMAGDSASLCPAWRALLENLTAAAARIRGDLPAVLDAAEWSLEHLADATPGRAIERQRLVATAQRAVALLWLGRLTEAHDLLDPAPQHGAPVPALVRASRAANSAWCDCLLGRLDTARATAADVVSGAVEHGWPAVLQLRGAYLTLAMEALLRGRLDDAEQAVTQGVAATAGGTERWPEVTLHLLAAQIAVSRRRPRGARAARELAGRNAGGHPLPPTVAPIAARLEVDLALLDPSAAIPEPSAVGDASQPWALAARARLAQGRGDSRQAVDLARRVLKDAGEGQLEDAVNRVEAGIVLALAADRDGHDHRAVEHLHDAIAVARGSGIARPFTTTGSDRTPVLLRRIADSRTHDAFLRTVLRLCQPTVPGTEPAPLLAPLSERELAVLSQLPTMRSNDEIAADLYVSVNTVKAHLKQIYRKLQARNRREAVTRARDLGLLR